jgi:hypothetical protein
MKLLKGFAAPAIFKENLLKKLLLKVLFNKKLERLKNGSKDPY